MAPITRQTKNQIISKYQSVENKIKDLAVDYRNRLQVLGQAHGEEILEILAPSTQEIFDLLENQLQTAIDLKAELCGVTEDAKLFEVALEKEKAHSARLTAQLREAEEGEEFLRPPSPLPLHETDLVALRAELDKVTLELKGLKNVRPSTKMALLQPEFLFGLRAFSGTDPEYTLSDYLRELEKLATLGKWDESVKKNVITLRLAGKASRLASRGNWDGLSSYQEIKNVLKRHFGEVYTTNELAELYLKIAQSPGEKVLDYAIRVEDLAEKYYGALGLEKSKWPQATLNHRLNVFVKGLRSELRRYIETLDLSSLDQAVSKASSREAHMIADNNHSVAPKIESCATNFQNPEDLISTLTNKMRDLLKEDRSQPNSCSCSGRPNIPRQYNNNSQQQDRYRHNNSHRPNFRPQSSRYPHQRGNSYHRPI